MDAASASRGMSKITYGSKDRNSGAFVLAWKTTATRQNHSTVNTSSCILTVPPSLYFHDRAVSKARRRFSSIWEVVHLRTIVSGLATPRRSKSSSVGGFGCQMLLARSHVHGRRTVVRMQRAK